MAPGRQSVDGARGLLSCYEVICLAVKKITIFCLIFILLLSFSVPCFASDFDNLQLVFSDSGPCVDGVFVSDRSISNLTVGDSYFVSITLTFNTESVSFEYWTPLIYDFFDSLGTLGLLSSDGNSGVIEIVVNDTGEDFGFPLGQAFVNVPVIDGSSVSVKIYSVSEPTDLLSVLSNVFFGLISWVGMIFSSMLSPSGDLFPLTALLCVGIAVSALLFAIWALHRWLWGL